MEVLFWLCLPRFQQFPLLPLRPMQNYPPAASMSPRPAPNPKSHISLHDRVGRRPSSLGRWRAPPPAAPSPPVALFLPSCNLPPPSSPSTPSRGGRLATEGARARRPAHSRSARPAAAIWTRTPIPSLPGYAAIWSRTAI
jgi:hypothetical protein